MTLSDLRALWRNHPKALSGFVLGLAVTLFFAVRLVTSALHWNDPSHFHEPVKAWMTIPYVAKSWHVYTKDLGAAAGLPPPVKGHPLTIRDIARQRGVPEAEVIKLVEDAVAGLRAGGAQAMTDWLLALVPSYGLWLLASVTFLACLALPVPCSVLMLAAGGFAATGDLVLWQVVAAALGGAVAGDQIGYRIGALGGQPLLQRLSATPAREKLVLRALSQMERRGAVGIFFTRWLFTPVGPWANFVAGAMAYSWMAFTFWAVAGEALWVGLYCGIGYGFAGNLQAASDMAGSALGIIAGVAAMLGFGWWLLASLKQDKSVP